ncbi:MAG: MBL fold metallo-hydrolase, partial [Bacteroidales bacterium]
CHCSVCTSKNPKNKRLRTSVLIEDQQTKIVIDAGPDFRYQMLKENIDSIDAILITHPHRDHVGGLDDIRPFNYYQQKPMPLYGSALSLKGLQDTIPYAFSPYHYPGSPEFELHPIEDQAFHINEIEILPIEVMHYKMPISAYRFGDLTYITDAKYISENSIRKIKGSKILIVNALRKEPHLSHFCIQDALEFINRIHPEKAYLTHIGHTLENEQINKELPSNVQLAYDGLCLNF